ncbi:WD repeat-containing protein 76 [Carica papaya]|uniref:WD repeat-containing protein 76 n=1 Tax=Carica papaya TaxID=3649 RepID=UPI000B8CC7FA|nr:WD repeat-containing protein 76 [Carica papaya]
MALEKLTEYERKRLENIKRNDEMMAALRIHSKAAELSAATNRKRVSKSYKSSPEKKPKSDNPVIIKRSLRTRGMPPDSDGLSDELLESVDKARKSRSPEKPSPKIMGPLSMMDACSETGTNKKFIDTVLCFAKKSRFDFSAEEEKSQFVVMVKERKPQLGASAEEQSLQLGALKEEEKPELDVSVKEKVACSRPSTREMNDLREETDEKEVNPSLIFTSCYDGFIRLMDAEKEVFELVHVSEQTIYSLSQRPSDAKSLYFGEGPGSLNIWDLRTGRSSANWELHDGRINSIDFNSQNPYIMATSSSNGTACIWDLRSMNSVNPKTLRRVDHERAVHSAYFSPSGSSLATTSFDNKIGILSGINFGDTSMIYHHNQTGRWISSFK